MSDEKQNLYLGKLIKRQGPHGDFYTGSICLSFIRKELISEFMGKKYLNVVVAELSDEAKKKDTKGRTHQIKMNDYKPEASTAPESQDDDEAPF